MRYWCPRAEHKPATVEGRILLDLALQPGTWRRGGMDGRIVGLDATEVLARAPDGLATRDGLRALIGAAEAGLIRGALNKAQGRGPFAGADDDLEDEDPGKEMADGT
ncbi:MAG: hypothetical protein QNI84_07935 [Henriciella sp.]|nr:hypothetical protein [Henriciella sp.]